MKTYQFVALTAIVSILTLAGCSPEDDVKIPNFTPLIFSEDFSVGAVDNTILNLVGWQNIAEVGTAKWKTQIFSSNPYAEFSAFRTAPEVPDPINIGWLISPAINMDANAGEILQFQASQSFVSSSANTLEALIATDYNGNNLTTANWAPLPATLPNSSTPFFLFLKSGEVDLSAYTGNINIAFRVKGSGTNASLDGSYQVDAIRIYTKK